MLLLRNLAIITVFFVCFMFIPGFLGAWTIWLPLFLLATAMNNFSFLREVYKKYWLPFLFKINLYLGGRTYAGRWVKRGQTMRLIGNAIVAVTIILLFTTAISITTFFTFGAAFPIWASVLMGLGMGLNFIALPIVSSCNTAKAQCYYDHEGRLRELNNTKANLSAETPHGLFTSHAKQRNMLLTRYVHDANGASGSALSALDTLAYLGALMLGPLSIAALFIASRASGLISVIGAPFTYKKRLDVHTENINHQILEYEWHCARINPILHARIHGILSDTFDMRQFKSSKYVPWLRFECYLAIERALNENMNESDIKEAIDFMLETVSTTKKTTNKISRKKLYAILDPQRKTPYSAHLSLVKPGTLLAPLDAMGIFQEQLYQKIKLQKDYKNSFPEDMLNLFSPTAGSHPLVLLTHLKSAYLAQNKFSEFTTHNIKQLLMTQTYAGIEIKQGNLHFNHEALTENFGMDTAHDKQFSPDCMKKLARSIANSTLSQSQNCTTDAQEIWMSVFRLVPHYHPIEYDTYDDHDILFHLIMACIIDTMSKKLTSCTPTEHISVKLQLRTALEIFAKTTTQDSKIKKSLRGLIAIKDKVALQIKSMVSKPLLIPKPALPFQYFSPEKIKSLCLWSPKTPYGMPEITLAEQAHHYFNDVLANTRLTH